MGMFDWLPKLDKCCWIGPLQCGIIIIIIWMLFMPAYYNAGTYSGWTPSACRVYTRFPGLFYFIEGSSSVIFLVCAILLIIFFFKKEIIITDIVCILLCILFVCVAVQLLMLIYWVITQNDYSACQNSYLSRFISFGINLAVMAYVIIIVNSWGSEQAG